MRKNFDPMNLEKVDFSKITVMGKIRGTLLGLVFIGVGVAMQWYSCVALLKSKAMTEEWHDVPAHIVSCEQEYGRNAKGQRSGGFKIVVMYAYTVEGKEYTGERVGVHSGYDNIGPFQERVYGILQGAKNSGKTVSCRVNPERAEEAILFPQVRHELLLLKLPFAIAFSVIGVAIICFVLFDFFFRKCPRGGIGEKDVEKWIFYRDLWIVLAIAAVPHVLALLLFELYYFGFLG